MNHKFITLRIPNLLYVFKIILDFLRSKCYTNAKGRCDTMACVYDVACWFLSKQSMTHKKVQKMCYYAQAWHCALIGKPLFNEEIQAWVHGPVIPKLYPKFADYGWNEISITNFEEPQFDDNALKVLEAVFETYGGFSGDQLESLTHSEDPWISARGNLKPWESCTTPITSDSMKAYYWQKYEESQND